MVKQFPLPGAVNDPPAAIAQTYSMNEGDTLTVSVPGVLDGFSDVDGPGPITAAVVTSPQHETLTLNADGSFVYTPAAGFHGTDSFTYTASDSLLQSSPATATITVGAFGCALDSRRVLHREISAS